MRNIKIEQQNFYWIRKYYFNLSAQQVADKCNLTAAMVRKAEKTNSIKLCVAEKLSNYYRYLYTKVQEIHPEYMKGYKLI